MLFGINILQFLRFNINKVIKLKLGEAGDELFLVRHLDRVGVVIGPQFFLNLIERNSLFLTILVVQVCHSIEGVYVI